MATSVVRATVPTSGGPDSAGAIDDLIKFRLVESMLRQPDSPTAASELATRLGFHSVELTATALDELVGAGVLGASRRSGALTYTVAVDAAMRAEVAELIAKGPPGLFNRLAAGSVSRIKKLLRQKD